MRTRIWSASLLALAALACADATPVAPVLTTAPRAQEVAALPPVRISEIHYDNSGTDAGEAIEISGPAGTDLAGWSLVLYNGNGGAPYDTRALSGTIADGCDGRGVLVFSYPVNGIQNGDPDGVALVNGDGAVVEFLTYDGSFTAVGGPADGMAGVDIGVAETSGTPAGQSLQRAGETWTGPKEHTFGACNADDVEPPPPVDLPPTRLAELHYDNDGTDAGEAIEVEGPAGTDLTGWTVVLYNGSNGLAYGTRALDGTIPALCDGRGVVALTYPANGIQNGSPDAIALVDAAGAVVEFLSYEGTLTALDGPASGLTSTDIGVEEPASTPAGQSLWRDAQGDWHGPAAATFGACNGDDGPPPPPPGNRIAIFGRDAGDALPVGFQDQLFADLLAPNGDELPTVITWSSDTPALAGVDQLGNVTALATGPAVLRATAEDGTTATFAMPIIEPFASETAVYGDHLEFGAPTDATPGDEELVTRAQYVSSYNRFLGAPNWVAYNLEASHVGSLDRCDCFTPDPALPADFPTILTSDYTGSGFSRGHLVKSADRTAGTLDNAVTFYFSNIIPQTSANNGGAWLDLENDLSDLARTGEHEIYVVAGGAGSLGTLKGEGKINIPASTWKVAVIMPRDQGLEHVDDASDVEIIAIEIPNTTSGVGGSWTGFRTSVDALEQRTGYDLLALLPDPIERVVEAQVGMRNVEMDVQPSTISVVSSALINVVLYSSDDFDAAAVSAAELRLVANGGAPVAPATRGAAVSTSLRDVNGDGRLDRLVGFRTSDLRAAGLGSGDDLLMLRLAGATWPWEAHDPVPPRFVP